MFDSLLWSFICYSLLKSQWEHIIIPLVHKPNRKGKYYTFSGVLHYHDFKSNIFICSLAVVYARGIHNMIMQILFCLLPCFEGSLLSLDSHPLLHKVWGKMVSALLAKRWMLLFWQILVYQVLEGLSVKQNQAISNLLESHI